MWRALLVTLFLVAPSSAFRSAPTSSRLRLVSPLIKKTPVPTNKLWEATAASAEVPKEDVVEGEMLKMEAAVQEIAQDEDQLSELTLRLRKYAAYFCNLFPVWTLITAATALARPKSFLGIPPSTFPAQIGLLMLCMVRRYIPIQSARGSSASSSCCMFIGYNSQTKRL